MTLLKRMVILAIVTFGVGLVALDARATYGARVTADEPQYLLTAISLSEDFDLDISDEIADERFRSFHEVPLNEQTIALNDSGQRLSPHDPLFPIFLALPVLLGGWVGAKVALAFVAGLTSAASLFLACRRFDAELGPATWVVGFLFISPPLTSYATQLYPAMPAALFIVLGVIAVTGLPNWRWEVIAIVSIIALPWLSVKYVPYSAVLAWFVIRNSFRISVSRVFVQIGFLAGAGAIYLLVHHQVYGGWTVYAAGDHFVNSEFLVFGNNPNYLARSIRFFGLLIDRGFGLIPWNPAYLAVPVALTWFAKVRRKGSAVLLAIVVVGWIMATWVALTMHGWWWPGRQIVPVLPLLAVVIAVAVKSVRPLIVAFVIAATIGLFSWLWLIYETSNDYLTLVFDFEKTSNPWYQLWRLFFPDHRVNGTGDQVLTWVWGVFLTISAIGTWCKTSSLDGKCQSH